MPDKTGAGPEKARAESDERRAESDERRTGFLVPASRERTGDSLVHGATHGRAQGATGELTAGSTAGLRKRRGATGRVLAFAVVALGGLMIFGGAVLFRAPLLERWYLRQLKSSEPQHRRAAILKLTDLGSRRAVPALLRLARSEFGESSRAPLPSARFVTAAPPGLSLEPSAVSESFRPPPETRSVGGARRFGTRPGSVFPPAVRATWEGLNSRLNSGPGTLDSGVAKRSVESEKGSGARRLRRDEKRGRGRLVRGNASSGKGGSRDAGRGGGRGRNGKTGSRGRNGAGFAGAGPDGVGPGAGMGAGTPLAYEIAAALVAAGDDAVEPLSRAYCKGGPRMRALAVEVLGVLAAGSSEAAGTVQLALRDPDDAVRYFAARAWHRHRGVVAVVVLVELLDDSSGWIYEFAKETLLAYGERSVPALLEGLRSERVVLRKTTLRVLAKLDERGPRGRGDSAVMQSIVPLLRDPSAGVRKAAVRVLGRALPWRGEFLGEVVKSLEDADSDVAIAAARALEPLGASADAAVPALIRMLEGESVEGMRWAARALAGMGTAAEAALPALLEQLALPEAKVAVQAIGGTAVLPRLIWLLSAGEPPERTEAAQAIGRFGSQARPAIEALIRALQDPHAPVRAGAASALGAMGSAAALAQRVLVGKLQDESPLVRVAAVGALGELRATSEGALSAVARLLSREHEADDTVRAAVLEMLAALGPDAASVAPAVLDLTESEDAALRREALDVLGRILAK